MIDTHILGMIGLSR